MNKDKNILGVENETTRRYWITKFSNLINRSYLFDSKGIELKVDLRKWESGYIEAKKGKFILFFNDDVIVGTYIAKGSKQGYEYAKKISKK